MKHEIQLVMHMDGRYQMSIRIVRCSCYLTGRIVICMKTSNYAKKENDMQQRIFDKVWNQNRK